ncbi:hypothetical protein MMC20_003343 [Loxospora ochrophaea]|nr:hypothetical protein [Loxospora ochrophaea]
MDVFDIVSRATNKSQNAKDLCTLQTCPIESSYYNYRPSLAANGVFLALFSLSLCGFLFQALFSRRFIGFSVAIISGEILEVLGYVGRVMSYYNPFNQNAFLLQIICLTIAPAFLAAGFYLCLSRIVNTFGPANSRISPRSYPLIFIPCDILSLMLQAAGGGIASTATHQNKSPNVGDHIMVAGLAFQVLTLLIFMTLCGDFAIKTIRRMREMGEAALDPTHAKLRASWAFKGFLIALAAATVFIFTRSVFRVAELGEGWEGAIIKNQGLFIGLEGVMVIIAMLVLNVFHPGVCFREGYDIPVVRGVKRRRGKGGEEQVVEEEKGSGSQSRDEAGSEEVRE